MPKTKRIPELDSRLDSQLGAIFDAEIDLLQRIGERVLARHGYKLKGLKKPSRRETPAPEVTLVLSGMEMSQSA